jgi:16S rRNA (uracil1498-N3)-methyltransferase
MAAKTNSKIRLYVTTGLGAGADIPLEAGQAHYLRNVMRRQTGDSLLLFNGRDGEWRAEIASLEKHGGTARGIELSRPQKEEPDLCLLFAPIKKARLDVIVEKATELGASRLVPVLTRHTDVERVKEDRLAAQVTEAAEQCERLSVPDVAEPQKLEKVLEAWPKDRPLIFADEAGGAPVLPALLDLGRKPAAILVGPEGGFAEDERRILSALPFVRRVSLGPRILRAETAALSLLALWQSACGDWASP